MSRERVDFWLDTDNPDHLDLLEMIQRMKFDRIFARSVRDGLRLVDQLNAGKIDLLESLYPDVIRRIQADYLKSVVENGGLSVGSFGVSGNVPKYSLNDDFEEVSETFEEAQERLNNSNSWLFD